MLSKEEAGKVLDKLISVRAHFASEKEALSQRLTTAQSELTKLESQCSELRSLRQSLLGQGKDAGETTKKINLLRDSQEVAEDTVTGITAELSLKIQIMNDNQAEIRNAEADVIRAEARELVTVYNQQAAEIAETVKNIQAIRAKIGGGHTDQTLFISPRGWLRNVFDRIPKLYNAGDKIPSNFLEQSFLDTQFDV
jgi:seryl-tRNA synthetase